MSNIKRKVNTENDENKVNKMSESAVSSKNEISEGSNANGGTMPYNNPEERTMVPEANKEKNSSKNGSIVLETSVCHNSVNISECSALLKYISINTCFVVDTVENKVKCTICNVSLIYTSSQGCKSLEKHLNSAGHKKRVLIIENAKETSYAVFKKKMSEWLVKNNIPTERLNHEKFTSFLEEYMHLPMPSESSIRKDVIPKKYEEEVSSKIDSMRELPFYIMFDESPDVRRRKVLNVLMGTLDENKALKPIIIDTYELENTTSELIYLHLQYVIIGIIGNSSRRKNFRVLISDKASYCISLGKTKNEKF